jgi:hypothetical protein
MRLDYVQYVRTTCARVLAWLGMILIGLGGSGLPCRARLVWWSYTAEAMQQQCAACGRQRFLPMLIFCGMVACPPVKQHTGGRAAL